MEGSSSTASFIALSKVVKGLANASKKIIEASLKIMKQLQDVDSEYIDDLLDELEDRGVSLRENSLPTRRRGVSTEDSSVTEEPPENVRLSLLNLLQEVSLKWTEDADQVGREIQQFIVEEDGVYGINLGTDVCPFLTEVWSGDSYDKTGKEGLQALLDDLHSQLKEISAENLINAAADKAVKIHGTH